MVYCKPALSEHSRPRSICVIPSEFKHSTLANAGGTRGCLDQVSLLPSADSDCESRGCSRGQICSREIQGGPQWSERSIARATDVRHQVIKLPRSSCHKQDVLDKKGYVPNMPR